MKGVAEAFFVDNGVGFVSGVKEVCDGLLGFGGAEEVEVFSGGPQDGV